MKTNTIRPVNMSPIMRNPLMSKLSTAETSSSEVSVCVSALSDGGVGAVLRRLSPLGDSILIHSLLAVRCQCTNGSLHSMRMRPSNSIVDGAVLRCSSYPFSKLSLSLHNNGMSWHAARYGVSGVFAKITRSEQESILTTHKHSTKMKCARCR